MVVETSIAKRRSRRLAPFPSPSADVDHLAMSPGVLQTNDQPASPPPIGKSTAEVASGPKDDLQINELTISSSVTAPVSNAQTLLMEEFPVSLCASALHLIIQASNVGLQ
jgi:hypothetical protein